MAQPHLSDGGARVSIPLPRDLDIKAATPLKAALEACRGRNVELDGAAVTRLGGQCLQVVLAAVRDWTREGREISIVNPSADLIDYLELLGVRPADDQWENAA